MSPSSDLVSVDFTPPTLGPMFSTLVLGGLTIGMNAPTVHPIGVLREHHEPSRIEIVMVDATAAGVKVGQERMPTDAEFISLAVKFASKMERFDPEIDKIISENLINFLD